MQRRAHTNIGQMKYKNHEVFSSIVPQASGTFGKCAMWFSFEIEAHMVYLYSYGKMELNSIRSDGFCVKAVNKRSE